MDIEAMKAELRLKGEEVRKLIDNPDGSPRPLSSADEAKVKGLINDMQSLRDRITLAKAGAVRQADLSHEELLKIGREIAGDTEAPVSEGAPAWVKARQGGAKVAALHPRVKAMGGKDIASDVIRRFSDGFGFKGILAGGTIAVDVPLYPEIVREDVPVLSIRQLMANVPNATGRFSYLKQTVRTNNAAVVAPGAKKPTSIYTVSRVDDRTRTIAHLSEPIAKQDLDDVALLQPFLNQEMQLGLDLALENEILNGDGTGEHFTGLSHVSGSQSQAFDTDLLTTARKAITKLDRFGYLATAGWVMAPEDWEAIELTADGNGRYYYGGPQNAVNAGSRRLWSVPVVVSDSATAGTAFLADFSQMKLQVRQEGLLDWTEGVYDPNKFGSGAGGTAFEANQMVFRYEGRFGLEILRPSSIIEVGLTDPDA